MGTYEIFQRKDGSCYCRFKEKTWTNRTLKAAIRAMKKEAKANNIVLSDRHIDITNYDYNKVHIRPDWFSIGLLMGALMTDEDVKKDGIVSRLIPIETRYGFPHEEFMNLLNAKFAGPYCRAASKQVLLEVTLNRIRAVYKRMDNED